MAFKKAQQATKRKFGRYIKGNVDEDLSLATLASKTLLSVDFDEAVAERMLVSSIVATYSLQDFTSELGDGPIEVGIAHSDYSDTEIEEVLENVTSWDEGNLVGQEIAKRKVRKIGVFSQDDDVTHATVVLNDGKPIKSKLNWILRTGQTLALWVYNDGVSAIATGSVAHVEGHVNLWPR